MNNVDRLELLSAYVDGEVSPEERRQVQIWLDTEPQVRYHYQRLLRLHRHLQHLPAPEPSIPSEALVDAVFEQIDKRTSYRRLAGIAGVAAALLAAAGLFIGDRPGFRFASAPPEEPRENLMVALNQPAVPIPPLPTQKKDQVQTSQP